MAPERITGQSYTINSDVWSLGVTLLEVAQHRFPFPADGTDMQPSAGPIDIIQYIVGQPLPKLKDEPAKNGEPEIKWSANFKYFIECWYVQSDASHEQLQLHCLADMPSQSRKGTSEEGDPLADARTPLDRGNEDEESQHGALLGSGLGLERRRLDISTKRVLTSLLVHFLLPGLLQHCLHYYCHKGLRRSTRLEATDALLSSLTKLRNPFLCLVFHNASILRRMRTMLPDSCVSDEEKLALAFGKHASRHTTSFLQNIFPQISSHREVVSKSWLTSWFRIPRHVSE